MKRVRQAGGPVHSGPYVLTPEQSAKAEEAIQAAQAEQEEARVNFRWNTEALDTIKRAAELMGVPYQTYLKVTVYRQAIADIATAKEAARPH